jgi:Icc-related predicted phosphoesterase
VINVAAVGDIHVGTDSAGRLRPQLEQLSDHADLLLIAGDVTTCGGRDEAKVLAADTRPTCGERSRVPASRCWRARRPSSR